MFLQKKRFFSRCTSSDERKEQAEEPDQRLSNSEHMCMVRHELVRLLVLAASLLALLFSFLSFLLTRTIVPLFASIAVIPVVYSCLDRFFRLSEHAPPS